MVSFEGSGSSVGAPWAPKRRPEGVRTGEVASDRDSRGGQDCKSDHVREDCLSELWEPMGISANQRELSQVKGQSLCLDLLSWFGVWVWGLAWLGLAWLGLAWLGLAWLGLV